VDRLFQPFEDGKLPTQLIYIAWEELKRGIRDEDREESATQIMESFTKQYQDLRDGGGEASTIIEEDPTERICMSMRGFRRIARLAHGQSIRKQLVRIRTPSNS